MPTPTSRSLRRLLSKIAAFSASYPSQVSGAAEKNAGLVTANIKADDVLAGTGVALRALMMPSFMDNLLRQSPTIKEKGIFSLPISSRSQSSNGCYVGYRGVAAKFLMTSYGRVGGRAGARSRGHLSERDGKNLSDVPDRPVRYAQTSFNAYKTRMVSRGMSEAFAEGLADMIQPKTKLYNTAPRRSQPHPDYLSQMERDRSEARCFR